MVVQSRLLALGIAAASAVGLSGSALPNRHGISAESPGAALAQDSGLHRPHVPAAIQPPTPSAGPTAAGTQRPSSSSTGPTGAPAPTQHGGSRPSPTHIPSVAPTGPVTPWHYTPNGNFDGSGRYLPGADGFNLADVGDRSLLDSLPAGDRGLVWLGMCGGADPAFQAAVSAFAGDSRVFGFYLMDEPDPTGRYKAVCPAANLKAESDWIHTHLPGTKTFVILMNFSSSSSPTYRNTYNPANTDIDLYGLDPYPCRTETNSCSYGWIALAAGAAESAGVPEANIVPVYQAFGYGAWVDDGGGRYMLPSAGQEQLLLSAWAAAVPRPAFDYAYSWGSQNGDVPLSQSAALQSVLLAHNR